MTVKFNDQSILATVRRAAMIGIVRGTEAVRKEAVSLILSSPKSGRVYARGGVAHQASAPGEAPASDTGRLAGSIRTEYDRSRLAGKVVASTEYAPHLEYGTARMEPRPYMRPALAAKRDDIERDVQEEVALALRRAGIG